MLRRHWPKLRRLLVLAFFGVVAVLLFRFARTVDWSSVVETLKGYRLQTLAPAIALATVSYLLYGSYDLLARRYTGHRISRLRTLAVALISYAFNLNLGALVGGAAFRLRLYSKVGLAQATVLRVIAFSVTTNWLGYLGVAAFAFTLASLPLPDDWRLAGSSLSLIGALAGLLALAWLGMCLWSKRREASFFGHRIELPSARLALLQLAVSSLNWLAIAAVIYLLLRSQVDYPTVLAIALLGAIAGALTHIPAGLGVLEAVFLGVLGAELGHGPLLAALLAYRAIYYVGPLALAVVGWLALEARVRR
ncbi:MAG: UPF0104 family protein [Limnobacter sp.]|nr:UPF0104 family protein [Limnobacter sp.]